jgi:hypothetical protein
MASGRPVVAADAMALPHLVHDGDNGYLFPPDDVDIFADRLQRVLTADKKELERLSENSLYLIQSHDIERTLAIFEGLYRGDQDAARTSDDNREDYLLPIGRLNARLHKQMLTLRQQTVALRAASLSLVDRAEDAVEEMRDKLEELRDEMLQRTKKANKRVAITAKKVTRKAKQVLINTAESLKSDD